VRCLERAHVSASTRLVVDRPPVLQRVYEPVGVLLCIWPSVARMGRSASSAGSAGAIRSWGGSAGA